jgi:TPR repeat protein
MISLMQMSLLPLLAVLVSAEPFDDGVLAFQEQRYDEAHKILGPLAAAGHDFAAVYSGVMHYNGLGTAKDYEKAAEQFQISAKRGNSYGRFGLAYLYANGEGVLKDGKQACKLYGENAELGQMASIINLGYCYYSGKSFPKDDAKALALWKKASDADEGSAHWNMARLYVDGRGVPKDYAEARSYFRKAFYKWKTYDRIQWIEDWEKKEPDQVQLWASGSTVYVSDMSNLPPRDEKAVAWVRSEAERGNRTGMRVLAGWYKEGRGVPKDAEEAQVWLAKASGEKEAPAVAAASGAGVVSDVDKPQFKLKERPDDFALVIGVEKYKSLPAASWAERDAAAVREHLLALGVPQRNLITLTGESATRGKLEAYLREWLPKNVKPDSRVFVYYSGHGAPDPETQRSYLVPWDGDAEFLQSTAYSLRDFYAMLNRLPAKEIVVALDSCLRPLVTRAAEQDFGRITVLSAAAGDQVTGALDEQGHGLFTYYLLKGLGGEAKDSSGAVTAKALHGYVKTRVEDEARRRNRSQSPVLAGQDGVLATFK